MSLAYRSKKFDLNGSAENKNEITEDLYRILDAIAIWQEHNNECVHYVAVFCIDDQRGNIQKRDGKIIIYGDKKTCKSNIRTLLKVIDAQGGDSLNERQD
ncbi:hypothetical protein ES705_28127 [subsurface metagenome]